MAGQIGIRELKERTSAIVKRIRERNEAVIITYRGRAVARIVPYEDAQTLRAEGRRVWRAMDELAKEIGAQPPPDMEATDELAGQRRVL